MTADFNVEILSGWLQRNVPSISSIKSVQKFPGGQSNPTYRVDTPEGAFVLRRKPFGELLPSAHAVDREFKLLSSLLPAGFPVPKPVILCEDSSIVGSMFYIMEMVEGRTFWQGTLPEETPENRRAIYREMVVALAQLHSLDYEAIGLGSFARSGNYFARQVDRWIKQYRASQTDNVPVIEQLIEWLPKTVPAQTRTSVIHGDFRIDNIIYAGDKPKVIAVLDWELATIGDPLADFAYLAMNYVMPADDRSAIGGIDHKGYGIPTLEEMTELYCSLTNRGNVPDLHWYFAYNLFRLTGIIQGIKKRIIEGNASSDKAYESAAHLLPLAEAAWEQAKLSGV